MARPVPMRLAERLGLDDAPTPHQLRMLSAVAEHGDIAKAARALGKPYYTVKASVRDASAKLGAQTTTHAVAIAIRRGLIS